MDFRAHVNFDHAADQRSEAAGSGCAYCDIVFEDSAARKRHFNNLECLVFLVCVTCNDKFDSLTMYIEHVYAEHLPQAALNILPTSSTAHDDASVVIKSEAAAAQNAVTLTEDHQPDSVSALRNRQSCTVCGKVYNNYYNMLRHMEVKHPQDIPLIYRCEKCDQRFPRQIDVREHMSVVHGIKMKRDTYGCRMCPTTFENRQPWLDHQEDFHSRFGCHLCDMETDNRSVFEEHLNEHSSLRGNQCTICEHSFNSERGLDTHLGVVHGIRRTQMPKRILSDSEERKNEADERNGGIDEKDDYVDDENDFGNDGDLDDTAEAPQKRPKYNLLSPNGDPNGIRRCRLCNETFLGSIALANHMRTHGVSVTRPPAHKSSSMMQRFRSIQPSATIKTKVISRMRCRICQKRIHTKTSYKRHMLNMHGVRDCVFIKCTVCPAEFSNDKGLKVHMFRTHQISVQQMQDDHRLRPVPKKESTSSETLPATKMFECDICHTVYRSHEQMQAHQATVHGIEAGEVVDVKDEPQSNDEEDTTIPIPDASYYDQETVWWQCRYCDETFNASKKLTIHMNSHEEHDTTDNTCTDCGNIYRTRKSLWVHRHKKHPRIPHPSPCEICVKVFFDKTELMHHLKTHSDTDAFSHLAEMQAQLAEEQLQQQQQQMHPAAGGEDLSCHICSQSFYDKRVLSKHLRVHENNGETGTVPPEKFPIEYSYPSYKGQMVDGEYACDMCPKTFPLINALKVHRGWHFRSPDGRQVIDTAHMWQPDQGRGSANALAQAASLKSSAIKRSRNSGMRIPSCPYCSSTFASSNNLRRHIVEVHKRNEARVIRENGTFSDQIPLEKELECRMCDITFSNRPEWVEHKIAHARTMKPSTNFEWGCEICGKIFTRKERLLAHMATHTSGKRNSSGQNSDTGDGGNSNSMSSASHSMSQLRQRLEKPREHPGTADSEDVYGYEQDEYMEGDEEEEEEHHTFGGGEEEDDEQEDAGNGVVKNEQSSESASSDVEAINDDDDNNQESADEDEEEQQTPKIKPARAYSCDLCQVFFKTAKELRRHVTSHIINGPEIPASAADTSSSESKSNRSSAGHLDGFKCRLCGSSSESHMDMIACMEAHKVVTSLRCGECKLYFSDADQVMNHEKLCHPNQFEA